MIQRLQSVFMLIASILCLMSLFGNLLESSVDGNIYELSVNSFTQTKPVFKQISSFYYLYALIAITSALTFFNIFLYKNRKLQMRLCLYSIFIIILVCLALAYNIYSIYSTNNELISYSYKLLFLPISIILLFFSYKGILRDEMLVRSLNRLR